MLVESDLAGQHADLVAEWGLSVHIKHEARQDSPVDGYWTGHCSGEKAYAALNSVLGGRLAEIHTGTTMTVQVIDVALRAEPKCCSVVKVTDFCVPSR